MLVQFKFFLQVSWSNTSNNLCPSFNVAVVLTFIICRAKFFIQLKTRLWRGRPAPGPLSASWTARAAASLRVHHLPHSLSATRNATSPPITATTATSVSSSVLNTLAVIAIQMDLGIRTFKDYNTSVQFAIAQISKRSPNDIYPSVLILSSIIQCSMMCK